MKQIYIIEHLEPELGKWCMIEYARISSIVGKNNLWFTNIKKTNKQLSKLGKVFQESVSKMKLENAAVLDPEAKKQLTPDNAKHFNYFIIGGILGDYPPKKRTKAELTQFIPQAEPVNIGKKQFSTDNAVYVTHKIASGLELKKIKTKYKIEVKIDKIASVLLPYIYPLDSNNQPLMSPELIKYLKNKKGL